MKYFYKFKSYLNAKHSVSFNGVDSIIHPHTWEFDMLVMVNQGVEISFGDFERSIEKYLNNYQGKILNDTEMFASENPTTEVILEKFYIGIDRILHDMNTRLLKIELSENPSRTYIISVDEK